MDFATKLNSFLNEKKRSQSKVVLCYRNASNIEWRDGCVFYQGKQLPWRTNWYFDKTQPFDLERHYGEYDLSEVVVVNDSGQIRQQKDETEILTKIVDASVWCSLEICLANKVYVVSKYGVSEFTPMRLSNAFGTHSNYVKVFSLINRWRRSDGGKNAQDELYNDVLKVVNNSNNKKAEDAFKICTAIRYYR